MKHCYAAFASTLTLQPDGRFDAGPAFYFDDRDEVLAALRRSGAAGSMEIVADKYTAAKEYDETRKTIHHRTDLTIAGMHIGLVEYGATAEAIEAAKVAESSAATARFEAGIS